MDGMGMGMMFFWNTWNDFNLQAGTCKDFQLAALSSFPVPKGWRWLGDGWDPV